MRPKLDDQELLEKATELLEQSFLDWRQAANGADHVVLIATTNSGQKVVLKAGSEANVDAEVLLLLESTDAPTPRLLGCGGIGATEDRYFLAVMTLVEGTLLAEASDRPLHHYLAPLIEAMRAVHHVTRRGGAGRALSVANQSSQTWKEYLLAILTGKHPEFDWPSIAGSHAVDRAVLRQTLDIVVRRVESLPKLTSLSLLHGDLNPYNVFVHEGAISGIVDWSYARFGDPLFDFARLRINPFVRSHPEAVDLYFELLNLNPAEREREQTYYLFNLIEYVNWYVLDGRFEDVSALMSLLAQVLSVQDGRFESAE